MKRLFFLVLLLLQTPLAHADISGPAEGINSFTCGDHTFTMSVRAEGLPNGCVLVEVERDFSDNGHLAPSSFAGSFIATGTMAPVVSFPARCYYHDELRPDGHYVEHERYLWTTPSHNNGFWRIKLTGTAQWSDCTSDPMEVTTGWLMVNNLHTATAPNQPVLLKVTGGLPSTSSPVTIPVEFSDGGPTTGTDVIVSIYNVNNLSTAVKTIQPASPFNASGSVSWDGTNNNDQRVADGLYTYKIHVEHSEPGWDCTAPTPVRNVSGTGGTDFDDDTSVLSFSVSSIARQGTAPDYCIPFDLTYSVDGNQSEPCTFCGLRVYYGDSITPVFVDNTLEKTPGSHTKHVAVPDCGQGLYRFVVWGRDGGYLSKERYHWTGRAEYSHFDRVCKRIAESGRVYDCASSTRDTSVTIDKAQSQPDPTSENEILFKATFSNTVNDFTEEDVTLDGAPANTVKAVSVISGTDGKEYDVHVTLPAGTGARVTATIRAGAAHGGTSAASTSIHNTVTYDPCNAIRVSELTGDDSNDGASWGQAKATVRAALAAADGSSRKEVWVAQGRYLTPDSAGFSVGEGVGLYGGFNGSESQRDQRSPSHTTMLIGTGGDGLIVEADEGSAVDGFCFAYEGKGIYTSNNCTIAHNAFYCGIGVHCECGRDTQIVNDQFSCGTGIWLESACANVSSNKIIMCGCGILSTGTDESTITNNTFVGNEGAILAEGYGTTTSRTIANNIVAFNTYYALDLEGGATADVVNNCFWENGDCYWTSGNLWQDPKFVDREHSDYHLASDSPCIDAGNDGYVRSITDYSGNPRIVGARVDMGAYEINSTGSFIVTVAKAAGQANPTSATPIHFTVTFARPVSDFASGDVLLSGTAGATTAVVSGSGTTYDVAVSGMTGSGTVTASMPAGAAHDTNGDPNARSVDYYGTVVFDVTQPTVSINQASGQADPTQEAPINFSVVFSEPVSGFIGEDVTLGGTAGATTAVVTGSGTAYNVAVTGMTLPGTVMASIAAGVVDDPAGNHNAASTSTDSTVNYIASVDLNTDSDNNNVVNGDDQESEEEFPGKYVDACGSPAELDITYGPNPGLAGWHLQLVDTSVTPRIRLWTTAQKETEIALPKVYNLGTDSVPTIAWVEGIEPGEVVLEAVLSDNQGVEICRDSVRFTVRPTEGITINNGDEYTSSSSVSLTLFHTDATQMRLRNENDQWSGWEPYVASTTWTLSIGDGRKTVYVQYRNSASVESEVLGDTITLGPTGGVPDYVLCVATHDNGGDDNDPTHDGTSWDKAFETVQHAIDAAEASGSRRHTIWVAAGDYPVGSSQSNVIQSSIRLYGGFPAAGGDSRNWHDYKTTLVGDGCDVLVVGTVGYDFTETVIDGFTIDQGWNGISCYCLTRVTIAHNTITDSSSSGIYADWYSTPIITNNVIKNSRDGYGVFVDCPADNDQAIVANNTISGSGCDGIHVSGDTCVTNNIVVRNGYGISAQLANDMQGNCSYDNASDNYYADDDPAPLPSSNISTDPFLDVDGAHILDCSPCIDRGLSIVSRGAYDIDRDLRMYGPAVDIGADEVIYSGCRVNMPLFSYGSGAYPSAINVHITADSGATIRYTIDGQTPTDTSAQVPENGVVQISGWKTLKAKAWLGSCASCVSEAEYNAGGPPQPYYVKTFDNGGRDSHSGKTWDEAFETVKHAIAEAQKPSSARKAIFVADGEYPLAQGDSYEIKDVLYLYGGYAPDGSDSQDLGTYESKLIGDGCTYADVVSILTGSMQATTVDGFTIQNGFDGIGCYYGSNAIASHNKVINNYSCGIGGDVSTNLTVSDCHIGDNYCAVYAAPFASLVASNNVIDSNDFGVYADFCAYPIVSNNKISSSTYCGIWLEQSDGISQPTFTNNTLAGGYAGIDVWGDVFLANNIAANNTYGIAAQFADNIQNNCSYGNTLFNYLPGGIAASNLAIDPMLENDGLHLTDYSPCIDKGLYTAAMASQKDIDGDDRKIGPAVDIGADERNYTGCRAPEVTFSIDGGVYTDPIDVTISSTNPSQAVITYSTNGGDPPSPDGNSQSSEVVHITGKVVLKAKSWVTGCGHPAYREATYYAGGSPLFVKKHDDGGRDGDGHTGTTWDDAFETIEHAISLATASGSQTRKICVAAGEYSPSFTGGYAWNGQPYFEVTKAVQLYGGFPADATGTSLANRNWETNVTTLKGDSDATLIIAGPSACGTVVDGFTLCDGLCGAYALFANATFSHNTVTNNAWYGLCSGLFTNPTISHNTVSSNPCGIYLVTGSGGVISDNHVSDGDWGVYGGEGVSPNIADNFISDTGCGIFADWFSSPVVSNNVVSFTDYCGMYLQWASETDQTVFVNNTVTNGSGAGIDVWGHVVLANNIAFDNCYGILAQYADEVQHNCSYGIDSLVDYWPMDVPLNNLTMDPIFASNGWRLSQDSPCIDQGLNSAAAGLQKDIEGEDRIIGSNVDIGADELLYSGCRVRMPGFNVSAGYYSGAFDVTVTCDAGDTLTCWIDEDEVTPAGGVVTIDHSCTLKAQASRSGCAASSIATATYWVTGSSPAVVIELTALPIEIRACTDETSEIRAKVTYADSGDPVLGQELKFHTSAGQFESGTDQTVYTGGSGDYAGVAIVTLSQGTASAGQTATITVRLPDMPPGAQLRVPIVSPAPYNVEVYATGLTSTGDLKITLYWDEVPNATGYNVYRGTMSGGEDYQHPVNGTTPVASRSYDGSSVFAFSDTSGLSVGTEYFYTVKAITACGESGPSDEGSDIPDQYGIPWDSGDASAITNSINQICGRRSDVTEVVGPDGTVFSSQRGVLRPGGPVDFGTLQPGSSTLQYSDGSSVALPDDGKMENYEMEYGAQTASAAQATSVPIREQNHSNGPYRRVRSLPFYTGSSGTFFPGWRFDIFLNSDYDEDYWTYLGCRSSDQNVEVDAGLQWSRTYNAYNPFIALRPHPSQGWSYLARILLPKQQIYRYDTQYGLGIEMQFTIDSLPHSRRYVPILTVDGIDEWCEFRTTVLAAAYPYHWSTGYMKRAHSIALKKDLSRKDKGDYCQNTGSYFRDAAFANGQLRDGDGKWGPWTEAKTFDQGAYPIPHFPVLPVVQWNPTAPFWAESGISASATYNDMAGGGP